MASVTTLQSQNKAQSKAQSNAQDQAEVKAPARVERRDLFESMDKVRAELDKVRSNPDPDNVHDLRVAIRRCRSVALVFEEVDPDAAWSEMRKTSKKLFRALAPLRDAHVMEDWVKKLVPASDPVRVQMHSSFETDEPELRSEVLRVAGKFDEKEWKRLQSQLRKRVRVLPVSGLAAECLAWERFEEIKQLHAQALRTKKAKPWHALRIGLKKLRYTVESLLPEHNAAWTENLRRLQDLLGDIHDLDVLAEKVKAEGGVDQAVRKAWKQIVQRERAKRVQTYRQLTLGKTSIWNKWRHALPHGERLEAASLARLRATARAAQSSPRNAGRVARTSIRVFELLRRAKVLQPIFNDVNVQRNLRAAALLHAVGRYPKHPRKAAQRFLLGLKVPPRWTREDWQLVAWAVRFHRGAEPTMNDGKFAKLSAVQQENIRVLAGVIRLGRVLHKSGVDSPTGFKIENSADAITLLVPKLEDNLEIAARLAAGKHLLETVLGKPLVVRAAEKANKVVALPQSAPGVLYAVAGASD
jgi:CHAD domain-containing protein